MRARRADGPGDTTTAARRADGDAERSPIDAVGSLPAGRPSVAASWVVDAAKLTTPTSARASSPTTVSPGGDAHGGKGSAKDGVVVCAAAPSPASTTAIANATEAVAGAAGGVRHASPPTPGADEGTGAVRAALPAATTAAVAAAVVGSRVG